MGILTVIVKRPGNTLQSLTNEVGTWISTDRTHAIREARRHFEKVSLR